MIKRLLVANRGEIAVRIMATASVLGIETVAVYPADDAACGHARRADAAVELPGTGAAAYLDVDAIVAGYRAGCDMLHPGCGSDPSGRTWRRAAPRPGCASPVRRPACSRCSAQQGAARPGARAGVPVLPVSDRDTSLEEARALLHDPGAVMVKAIADGGGRGVRPVMLDADLAGASAVRLRGDGVLRDGRVYVEQLP